MRFFLISDNIDTQIGLRLAGIKGVVVHTREEILPVLEEVEKDPTVGVILMTEKIAEVVPDQVQRLKLSRDLPLLTIIPDRHGTRRNKDFILNYVESAIGVKVK
ncbi:MAG: V/A-type H+/Na+-transporting ATPase subunit [Candidatus Atribacteria bacterium]|uniref:V-type ATP synthase subunit F n=1 Tax=Thermatribacter velox TaxID=3039681 RepID=A0ABZ2YFJ2_9BACT|nr:V/A-type H+/Na+-transporting ATPase subunit [Candidatus Atribacteria bacterium]MDI3531150.1 V/A-type H+/Na+-transporting ATPase subunit [Candidatus Atribacteria bacterium]